MVSITRSTRLAILIVSWLPLAVMGEEPAPLPSSSEMAASLTDVWGDAAMARPGGPSYEFFKDLLPPLRYVNTAFRHYPIVLCAPAAPIKARWVSDGSGVNLRADKKPMWKEVGFPVRFHVGATPEPFGAEVTRLDGPRYREGFLPIVQVGYSNGGTTYDQEAFVAVGDTWAAHGAVFLRFSVREAPGTIAAALDQAAPFDPAPGAIRDAEGRALVLHDDHWTWDASRNRLRTRLDPGEAAVLVVLTRPLPPPFPPRP